MTQMPPDIDPDIPPPDESLQALLAPVPGPDPCGVSLRAESLFTDIRLAREEDDPSLPMRQWERPLKKADWPLIVSRCTEALAARSKDLQLAAWLAEAWTRQGAGVQGLARGLQLLQGLVDRYWDGLYPRIDPPEEGGDCEARIAPLEWLDGAMAHTLRAHVVLFPLAQRKPAGVTLAGWERLIASELSPAAGEDDADEAHDTDEPAEPALTREDVIANLARHAPGLAQARLAQVREARAHLVALRETLEGCLGPQAPAMRLLMAALDVLERVLLQVQSAMPPGGRSVDPPDRPGRAGPGDCEASPSEGHAQEDGGRHPAALAAAAPAPKVLAAGAWRNRDEAYHTLEALAEYLVSIEPHSPTPYLIRRAVNWGRLPLPELMAEIMQEEGDLNRMVQLLGLNR